MKRFIFLILIKNKNYKYFINQLYPFTRDIIMELVGFIQFIEVEIDRNPNILWTNITIYPPHHSRVSLPVIPQNII